MPEDGEELGYVETAPLPQWKPLAVAQHRETGRETLVLLPDDPLLAKADVVRVLGFVEPLPLEPSAVPDTERSLGLVGLVKSIDQLARRHRYALGAVPPGELSGELGALAESELQGSVGAWIEDGRLLTERHRPPPIRPGSLTMARWVLEPAAWHDIAGRKTRLKAGLRRGMAAAQSRTLVAARNRRVPAETQTPAPPPQPEAWLYDRQWPGLVPLFASYHPVTGDQLLSRSRTNGPTLGYGAPELLGFIRQVAPVTGDNFQKPLPLPWARRLGAVPREQGLGGSW